MSKIQDNLISGETILYRTKLHAICLLAPALASLFFFLLIFPLFWLIIKILEIKTSEFALTDKRVIIHTGIIRSRSIELLLNKIESIEVSQRPLEKLVNSGTMKIGGTGGTKEVFRYIENPFEFRKQVQEHLAK